MERRDEEEDSKGNKTRGRRRRGGTRRKTVKAIRLEEEEGEAGRGGRQ